MCEAHWLSATLAFSFHLTLALLTRISFTVWLLPPPRVIIPGDLEVFLKRIPARREGHLCVCRLWSPQTPQLSQAARCFRLAMQTGSLRRDLNLKFALGTRTHLSYFYLLHAHDVNKFEGSCFTREYGSLVTGSASTLVTCAWSVRILSGSISLSNDLYWLQTHDCMPLASEW